MAIPNKTQEIHHIGEAQQEFKAGIRSEDFPHIANLLINLYSDPITAVMREYSTNALDAHIDAGNPDPINVTLPSADNLEFVVQDFGIGLSVDDLENIYSMYGRSTKRDSNSVVGQLGLGCKSGLTYADAFTITAVKNGVKVVAMSTKDEHGVGCIKVIDTASTDEPNGVKITIPVGRWDVDDFAHKAEELFSFWEPGTVLVNGEEPEVPEWRKMGMWIDDDVCIIPDDIGFYESYVIMGNVAYSVPDAVYGPQHRRVRRRFIARLNLGDIDFVPSREQVHMTSHTRATLEALTEYISDRFDDALAEKIAECPTRWDETLLKVLWKGSSMRISAGGDKPIWNYNPTGYGKKASGNSTVSYDALKRTAIVVVIKFPNRTLATAHRERLREMFPDCKQFVVIPDTSDVGGLDGRENVVTWDKVLGETKAAAKAKRSSEKRDETTYFVPNYGHLTAAQIDDLPGKKMYIHQNDYAHHGNLGGVLVNMYSNRQSGRLERLVSGITNYWDEVAAQREAAEAAITDEDRKTLDATGLASSFARLNPDEIDDPELATAIRRSQAPKPDSITTAERLHARIFPADWQHETPEFDDRYPLVGDVYTYRADVAEIIIYINAKYAALQAEAEAKAEMDENQMALDFVAA